MLAKIALVLWLITIGIFGWFVYNGQVIHSPNSSRTVVLLNSAEREYVLAEMRGMLSSVQKIILGVANDDRAAIAKAASAAGMSVAADDNPSLLAKLPMELKTLGFSAHKDMDALAAAANNGASYGEILNMLGSSMAKCVACHQAWQLSDSEKRQ
jgi:hypothetical protein